MNAMPWVLTALAAASAVYRLVLVLARAVSSDALTAVLLRLIRAGDLSRARKLLSAIDTVPVGIAMDRVIVRAGELPPRSDQTIVRATLEKTFEETFAGAIKTIEASRFLSVLAIAFVAGAIATSFQLAMHSNAVLIAAGCVVVAVGYATQKARAIRIEGPRVFEKTLPALIERVCAPSSTYRTPSEDEETAPLPAVASGEQRPKKGVVFVDVLRAGAQTRHLELAEPVIKIGTHTAAHVSVEAEKGIGRMHAVIERTDDGAGRRCENHAHQAAARRRGGHRHDHAAHRARPPADVPRARAGRR
jgi:hypothetical protein